MIKQVNENI